MTILSRIIKVCKGKTDEYAWKYVNREEYLPKWRKALNSIDWIGIAEAVKRTGRNRNVIYYQTKKHVVPTVISGRIRLYIPSFMDILK